MNMNWLRGFLRVWAVASIIWLCAIGWSQFYDWEAIWNLAQVNPCGDIKNQDECEYVKRLIKGMEAQGAPSWQGQAVELSATLFGPVIYLLALGLLIGWLLRRFRPAKSN
jgi:hypothetical protein